MAEWQTVTMEGQLVIVQPDRYKLGGLTLTLSDADDTEWTVTLSPREARELRDALAGWLL